MNDIDTWTNDIHHGDARETLLEMPDSSVHMVMTSPPYWNLRDYGEADQLGLEETPKEFVENLADVFDEVKRVLRPDGSLWLNLGDTYHNKDLQQIPARVALELQSREWILRNRVTWAKPNPMPQSVKDRLNDTTEAVFHFVKNKDYWYDLDAIREAHVRNESSVTKRSDYKHNGGGQDEELECHPAGKNPGDVFEVTTKPFPDAHFAVYPPELCEKPIKATCPPTVCAECGSPYERETRDDSGFTDGVCNACGASKSKHKKGRKNAESGSSMSAGVRKCSNEVTIGWQQTCDCDADATEAGIALDPFAGAGTTAMVAKEHGRRFVGIDLNDEYVAMAQKRLGLTVDNPEYVRDDCDSGLEEWT